jgi:hypothetical protein
LIFPENATAIQIFEHMLQSGGGKLEKLFPILHCDSAKNEGGNFAVVGNQ